MTDLATWLLEQIAADEEVARAAVGRHRSERWHLGQYGENVMCFPPSAAEVVEWNLQHNGPERAAEHARCGGFQTDPDTAPHIVNMDPARVLAECAAKRAIVGVHAGVDPCDARDGCTMETITCDTLRHLAAVYADRPGYDEAWRP